MNYPKKTGFNIYQSQHCAYITYSVNTWFLKIVSVSIDYSDFTLSGTRSTTVFVQSLYDDYTPHSLNIF